MGIAANPPPQSRLPDKIINDDELRGYFVSLQNDLYRLWLRSGGETDDVSDINDQIIVINARLDAIELRLDLVEARVTYLEGLTIVTAIDLTIDNAVTGHQTIVCTTAVTIKLDATPTNRDTAIIKVGQKNTEVIIDGNGKLIEEDTTMKLRRRNTKRQIGMVLEYSSSLDRWFTT
jgi:hypothetical protein